jgi:hypothetical protein
MMDEERTDIVVEIILSGGETRRITITVPISVNPGMAGDTDYLVNTVRDLRYIIIDQLRADLCAETGAHPDEDVDVSDFEINDWWPN